MRVIGIVGFKKSGKTSLGIGLAKVLNEMGRKVSVIKHVNEGLDFPVNDSRKYSEFAESVVAVSAGKTEMLLQGDRDLDGLLIHAPGDIVLVEGFKKEKTYPKIVCLRGEEDREALLDGLEICTAGMGRGKGDYDITDPDHIRQMAALAWDRAFKLPGLDCGKCGYESCYELATRIVRGEDALESCLSLHPSVTIRIDGKLLPLNAFTDGLIRNTIHAMLSTFKGYRKGTVEITIP
ncbi:MAG: molybdopterin-guanine dinucleotide biosynthesis protein MobB [Deltaproteobacteria bacterium]|nr:molybdopterin-guanine dinucleotide biosynthesis protein MobB [Deltaproteobacteria bacterium]MBW2017321.1 molybdopterin-guanine dinucleotide biosynthesis protein MobB [Deltaproteobacteria bacterium]MBW2129990.1 molybdopterin-guanine dinucleotide biosynthesis protein MobB [Deltaproteobacteria bacterium]MBW2304631.1 molybdopterin-guanine dinucleotide biosynthesis protein MobB [Deltaproteobacteria bacterium]